MSSSSVISPNLMCLCLYALWCLLAALCPSRTVFSGGLMEQVHETVLCCLQTACSNSELVSPILPTPLLTTNEFLWENALHEQKAYHTSNLILDYCRSPTIVASLLKLHTCIFSYLVPKTASRIQVLPPGNNNSSIT